MDGTARLQEVIAELNRALADVTPYRLAVVNPADVQPVERNARYMPKRTYDQLVANIRQDHNLSSLPFCWRRPDGRLESLSGNHRIQAAKDAGIAQILVLYTDAALTRGERVAIQLSHNSLVGEDEPTALRELWQEIDTLDAKVYSGLDDGLLEVIAPIAVTRLNDEPLRMEELTLLFVQPEIERIQDVLKRLETVARPRLVARLEDFDRFFEELLQLKEQKNIINTSTAFLAIVEILEAWLEQNEAEHEQEEPASGD